MNDSQTNAPAVLVDTTRSPQARLKPVPLAAVKLTDRFWVPRLTTNREVTLPSQYELLEETGRIDNFRRAAGTLDVEYRGRVYNDSDVYKWLEGAIWALATGDHPPLARQVETVISAIEAAQAEDGYLNTFYTFERASERWSNLKDDHELYCAGHLIQAAIAHYRTTGSERLLTVARRFADLIVETFGPADAGQQPGVPGHPELEMALIELARVTGDERYLAQARYFLDARGHGLIGGRAYYVDHEPFIELTRLAGHAVRALYLCAGATDLYAETGDLIVYETLVRLWERMVARQLYVTGGVGARYEGESFGADYELPNARAYAETCAAIAVVMWSWRMLQVAGEARYADLLELALYNAFLPGIALDGQSYFYENPLASDGSIRRRSWFTCACCPTNIVRLLATLPSYIYSVSDDTIWVHLYAAGEVHVPLPDGREVLLMQRTRYPWDGNVTIEVLTEGKFTLRLRVPGWCGAATCSMTCSRDAGGDRDVLVVNGEPATMDVKPGSYLTVRRRWQPGDTVCLRMPMPARKIAAHPYALENAGRVALMRGPLLYCLEQVDHPGIDLRDIAIAEDAKIEHEYTGQMLGGVELLHVEALVEPPDAGWEGQLYRPLCETTPQSSPVTIKAVPYHVWGNREPGAMLVWLKHKA